MKRQKQFNQSQEIFCAISQQHLSFKDLLGGAETDTQWEGLEQPLQIIAATSFGDTKPLWSYSINRTILINKLSQLLTRASKFFGKVLQDSVTQVLFR